MSEQWRSASLPTTVFVGAARCACPWHELLLDRPAPGVFPLFLVSPLLPPVAAQRSTSALQGGDCTPALCLQHGLHRGSLPQRLRRSAKGARELSRSATWELDLDIGAFRGLEGDSAPEGTGGRRWRHRRGRVCRSWRDGSPRDLVLLIVELAITPLAFGRKAITRSLSFADRIFKNAPIIGRTWTSNRVVRLLVADTGDPNCRI